MLLLFLLLPLLLLESAGMNWGTPELWSKARLKDGHTAPSEMYFIVKEVINKVVDRP